MRRHLPIAISIVALVSGPGDAVAGSVARALFAKNADKVDGKHAVGASASVAKRKGKVVATSPTTGMLPNNIIALAPNAAKVGGVAASDLHRVSVVSFEGSLTPAGFDSDPLTITVPRPGIVTWTASCELVSDGTSTSAALNLNYDNGGGSGGVSRHQATPATNGDHAMMTALWSMNVDTGATLTLRTHVNSAAAHGECQNGSMRIAYDAFQLSGSAYAPAG